MLKQQCLVSALALLLGMLLAPSSPAFDLEGHRGTVQYRDQDNADQRVEHA